jgi:hypothetical protein
MARPAPRRPAPTPAAEAPVAQPFAVQPHVAVIKRFCKVAVACVMFTTAVIAIVALKAAVWIPHFTK